MPSVIAHDRETETSRYNMSRIDMGGVIGYFCQTVARMVTSHSQEVTIDRQARGEVCILSFVGCFTEDTLHDLHGILHKTVRFWVVQTGHIVFDAPFIGELPEELRAAN